MNNCAFILLLIVSFLGCGGGESDNVFDSLNGTWQIDVNNLISYENCGVLISGGLSGNIMVEVSGDTVTINLLNEPMLSFSGLITSDGFISQSFTLPNNIACTVEHALDLSQVDSLTYGSGTANYGYRSTCPDGSECLFSTTGPAIHLTEPS